MCDEPQPRLYCSCGHHVSSHPASPGTLGACKQCQCTRYAGPRFRYPDWVGKIYHIDGSVTAERHGRNGAAAAKPESYYRDLLARQVGGRTEAILPFGRADVLTDTTIFEVEPAARWRLGVSQALQYAAQVPQQGALALYGDGVKLAAVRAGLASLPSPGLELWWLAGDLFVRVKEIKARAQRAP